MMAVNWTKLALWLAAIAMAAPATARDLVVGQPAPDFRLRLSDGSKVSLADLKGQVIVLNLWATWCGPCKREMPGLDLMQINGAKYGLHVFGVLVLDETSLSSLKPLVKVLHYPLSTYIGGGYVPIRNQIPTNYIIDRKGILRYAKAAALDKEDFANLLVPLLNERADPAPVTISETK
jgi:thiol-disulfide isomerase/thioredoxin